ncbi:MAG: hypothetical protein IKL05_05375 [Clostridia bacterium]|nr:hypothetical protein [Clostridia bacterium]
MTELKLSPRLAFTITNTGNEKKLKEAFEASGSAITFSCHGHGTAPSAMMELFGLSGREKLITAGFLDRTKTAELFRQLDEKLSFSQKGRGIAFTLSPSSMQSQVMALLKREEQTQGDENEMKEQAPYVAILAAVTGGYSDDVVEAARSAGARGGTIIKGMRDGSHEVSEALGIPLMEEQDFVLILVPRENKLEVMNAITTECGINTEAHGVVSAFNLDEVFGL